MLGRMFALFRRARLDRDLDHEVRFHLEMLEAEYRARGMSPREATLAARREFGAIEPMKETYRDRRGVRWIDDLLRDLRHAVRGLCRNPGFTVASVLSLALGIGANVLIFSVFYALLLRTLPVREPGELLSLYRTGGWGQGYLSHPLYQDLRTQTGVFQDVLARSGVERVHLRGERTQTLEREYVSGNYFSLLGVQPAAGRLITTNDSRAPGLNPVAVLSYDAWRTRFGLDPKVVGRNIVLDGRPLMIVGVAQPGFSGVEVERPAEIWVPLTMSQQSLTEPGAHWLWAIGRRRPGVTEAAVQAQVSTIMARFLERHYGQSPNSGFKHMAMGQQLEVRAGGVGISTLRESIGKPVGLLMGAVALVLLVACANVAGLMLARGAARTRETALRFSLGASRWRLVRQWLAESALLAVVGAALGWAMAASLSRPVSGLLSGVLDAGRLEVRLQLPVLWFATAAAAGSAVVFGLIAGFGSTAGSSVAAAASNGRMRLGARRTLVIAQVALSVMLVVTAALLVRSLMGLRSVDLGFRNEDLLTFNVDVPTTLDETERAAVPGRLLERLSALPGVISASGGFPGPYQGGYSAGDLFVPGRAQNREKMGVARQVVRARFFETLGSPPLSGREFDAHDSAGAKIALVNQAFAREFFDGRDPVGRTLGLNQSGPADLRIVGLVRDMRHGGVREAAISIVYLPGSADFDPAWIIYTVRARIPRGDLLRLIQREVGGLGPDLSVEQVRTLGERVDRSLFRDRMLAWLSLSFGALAVLMAAIGIYGVVAFVVARRTAEIGVRMALGARPSKVGWLVLSEALWMVAAGLAIGLPASLAATRLTRSFLFGVRPYDPVVFVTGAAVLLAAGTCAALLPAHRAASIEPSRALRTE